MRKSKFLVLGLMVLAACASPSTKQASLDPARVAQEAQRQKEMVAQNRLERLIKVQNVADPILRQGTQLCGDKVGPRTGIIFQNLSGLDLEKDWKEAYISAFRLDRRNRLTVVHIPPGSPSSQSGLKAGDVITHINGKKIKPGKKSLRKAGKILDKHYKKNGEEVIRLTVERNGVKENIEIKPVQYCTSPVQIVNQSAVNAFATGKAVYVTTGMMNFVESDDELATVIGHEVAHNAMRHVEKKKKNALGGAIIGGLIDVLAGAAGVNTGGEFTEAGMKAGAQAYSVAFEQEADYVGMYFLKRAGFGLTDAPNFWRRMATVDPDAISYSSTHPTTAQRFVALDQTAQEINMKSLQGLALVPDMEDDSGNADQQNKAFASTGAVFTGVSDAEGSASFTSSNRRERKTRDPVADDSAHGLLLGSYLDAQSLRSSWEIIANSNAEILRNMTARANVVEEGEGATRYQLIGGPIFDEDAARTVCDKLQGRAQFCSVTDYSGIELQE